MQWWCAATAADWSWAWRPYPGVWLVIGLIAVGYLGALTRARRRATVPSRHPVYFAIGLASLWAILDWPIGALGAGYLLSVHTLQYIVLTLVAMPLLLVGLPQPFWPDAASGAPARWLRRLAHPALGLALFAGTMAITHVPAINESLMKSQLGSFGVDMVWLLGAFGLWWPVLAPAGYVRMSLPVQIGYLFVASIPPTLPAAFMVFADYPIYGLYELAPRVGAVSAGSDQQTAGLIMKACSDPILWIAMAIIFFRWQRAEGRADREAAAPTPQELPS